ncbi:zinc-dependent metalloprotease [Actinopolyspora mortivallis]|uniref:zinc-dependent metalloprotease n=1 Tax=Actinopolyspora mortivallis TaxID=33906 RepID=UPI002159B174|nr:zinc-dependent metalloprotease [Actinopolyspora mortivallis]
MSVRASAFPVPPRRTVSGHAGPERPGRIRDERAAAGAGSGTIDWDLAVGTAARLLGPGPEISRAEADSAVASLREYSVGAETHVREVTGLGAELPVRSGDVVDRPGWLHCASRGLAELTETAVENAVSAGAERSGELLAAVSSRGAGLQAGVVLAYLGSKVLGQYDPFAPAVSADEDPGRLLLVAPNIVTAQRALDVPERDFHMWVCLHESTHRLQFNAVPWLREYFADSVGELMGEMDGSTGEMLSRVPAAVREVRSGRSGEADTSPGVLGLVELLQTPQQRAALDRIIAVSTLLEGHADHVMDAVGPRVVPSVRTIRERFTRRRAGGGLLDRVLRSLLGMDAKIKQYAKGAEFTRHVVDTVGMDGFNAVWSRPDHLPTRAELSAPAEWVRRVHG